MGWIKLCLRCDNKVAEPLGDWLMAAGAGSVTYQDLKDEPIYEPDPLAPPLWRHTITIALFDSAADVETIIRETQKHFPLLDYRLERLEDKNWEQQWLQYFQPMRFGKHLWVCPENSPPDRSIDPDPQAKFIHLNPGLAFGTGTHATTRLCLEWIADHLPTGAKVVDYGCGSGILAIAAAKLGADPVWAVDLDPQALLATTQNARNNGVEHKLRIGLPSDLTPFAMADVVIANILLKPLMELRDSLISLLAADGWLVLSGILEQQYPQIISSYEADISFTPGDNGANNPVRIMDEWCCLIGKRR